MQGLDHIAQFTADDVRYGLYSLFRRCKTLRGASRLPIEEKVIVPYAARKMGLSIGSVK